MRRVAVAGFAMGLCALTNPALAQVPPIDRGQALIEGMGCAGCHDPAQDPAWSGMHFGGWLAPDIMLDPISGIGA